MSEARAETNPSQPLGYYALGTSLVQLVAGYVLWGFAVTHHSGSQVEQACYNG